MTGPVELEAAEIRVLGALIEKQRTTPDAYPLSLNALRLACNQSTNREPLVDYDEATVRAALDGLGRRRLTRLTSHAGSRAAKFRQLAGDTLELEDAELSLLAILMLRGPQTVGELRTRSERLHAFASFDEMTAALERLAERGLAARLDRRPGQREDRYEQLLGGAAPASAPAAVPDAEASAPAIDDELGARVERLEADVRELRAELSALRRELGG